MDDKMEETEMLAEMLKDDGLLFLSGNCGPFFQAEAPDKTPVSVWVNCNDIFAWACADAEPLPMEEIRGLYEAWKADKRNGVLLWSCRRRGMRPQDALVTRMKKAGDWTPDFEALPEQPA